jgi:Virus neck protein
MATNVFFRNYDNVYEQNLIDDLVIESIQIYGIDVIYLSRTLQGVDRILNEDDMPLYENYYEFETYVRNVDSFEGEGDFLSKFGLQIRDQMTLTVAIRTFERFVTRNDQEKIRPLEGDIIWLPLNQKMYEIKFVEHESVFYQSGSLQVYDMRCELLEYSNQRFDTGRPEIDQYFDDMTTVMTANTGVNTLTKLANTDPIADNLFFEQEADGIIDFSEIDPFSENITIQD